NRLGLVEGEEVIDVSAALDTLAPARWPYPMGDALVANWESLRPAIENAAGTGARSTLSETALLSPVANPSKIIGIARNRRDLASESDVLEGGSQTRRDEDPVHMFIKATSALAGPSDGVALRFLDRRNDPEAELSVVIGKKGSDIPRAKAFEHVFGYCIGLDMTLRGSESPSSRKSIDGYAILGPWIATRDEIPDPDNVENTLRINDRLIHQANTRDFAFDVVTVIAHASTFYTLYPGDVIMAGTPAISEPVKPGDTIIADFEGIGAMTVSITAHER
ncbi:MAG TPA: fumarylacetoacetate hydrolase family protein, partial [Alphaproteobacteria bacterium]|nr:fumarylacetoacetate hydrolase family protein [Alphaproteobacteria bacterium]